MKYLLLTIAVLTLLAFTWEPPAECDDADREIPGNRTTPCKLELPTVTVEYRFRMEYPECVEEMAFHILGIGKLDEQSVQYVRLDYGPHQSRRLWVDDADDGVVVLDDQ